MGLVSHSLQPLGTRAGGRGKSEEETEARRPVKRPAPGSDDPLPLICATHSSRPRFSLTIALSPDPLPWGSPAGRRLLRADTRVRMPSRPPRSPLPWHRWHRERRTTGLTSSQVRRTNEPDEWQLPVSIVHVATTRGEVRDARPSRRRATLSSLWSRGRGKEIMKTAWHDARESVFGPRGWPPGPRPSVPSPGPARQPAPARPLGSSRRSGRRRAGAALRHGS